FGVGVVMVAGAGSTMKQQFDMPVYLGRLIMIILMIATMLLEVDKVVAVIGSITPFLILAVVVVSIYSVTTKDTTYEEMEQFALKQLNAVSNLFIGAVNIS